MRYRQALWPVVAVVGLGGHRTLETDTGQRGATARHVVPSNALAHLDVVVEADASAYDRWLNGTIERLSGDDASEQRKAAEQLMLAVVYPPVRTKVLAALEPHLNGSDKDLRLRCVKACGHWATEAQVPKLQAVVAAPANPPKLSGAEPCWAAAVTALVSLDPAAARKAIEQRIGDFFFRADLTNALVTLTAENGPDQPRTFKLLK